MSPTSLGSILDRKTIITDLKADTKYDVIKELAKKFFEQNYIDSIDEFVEAVYEREGEGATGIGNGVAIPHGKSTTVKRSGVAIAILEHEIKWESLDDTGAKVVVLFDVGNDSEGGKKTFAYIVIIRSQIR